MPVTVKSIEGFLRGMPKGAAFMVRTPDGLKPVLLLRPCYISSDGKPPTTGQYVIILETENHGRIAQSLTQV